MDNKYMTQDGYNMKRIKSTVYEGKTSDMFSLYVGKEYGFQILEETAYEDVEPQTGRKESFRRYEKPVEYDMYKSRDKQETYHTRQVDQFSRSDTYGVMLFKGLKQTVLRRDESDKLFSISPNRRDHEKIEDYDWSPCKEAFLENNVKIEDSDIRESKGTTFSYLDKSIYDGFRHCPLEGMVESPADYQGPFVHKLLKSSIYAQKDVCMNVEACDVIDQKQISNKNREGQGLVVGFRDTDERYKKTISNSNRVDLEIHRLGRNPPYGCLPKHSEMKKQVDHVQKPQRVPSTRKRSLGGQGRFRNNRSIGLNVEHTRYSSHHTVDGYNHVYDLIGVSNNRCYNRTRDDVLYFIYRAYNMVDSILYSSFLSRLSDFSLINILFGYKLLKNYGECQVVDKARTDLLYVVCCLIASKYLDDKHVINSWISEKLVVLNRLEVRILSSLQYAIDLDVYNVYDLMDEIFPR